MKLTEIKKNSTLTPLDSSESPVPRSVKMLTIIQQYRPELFHNFHCSAPDLRVHSDSLLVNATCKMCRYGLGKITHWNSLILRRKLLFLKAM